MQSSFKGITNNQVCTTISNPALIKRDWEDWSFWLGQVIALHIIHQIYFIFNLGALTDGLQLSTIIQGEIGYFSESSQLEKLLIRKASVIYPKLCVQVRMQNRNTVIRWWQCSATKIRITRGRTLHVSIMSTVTSSLLKHRVTAFSKTLMNFLDGWTSWNLTRTYPDHISRKKVMIYFAFKFFFTLLYNYYTI